jgi:hypothetical protein
VGEVRDYPSEALSGAHGFTDKDKTILEGLARDKHSSLLRTLVKQLKPRNFYNIWPWQT